MQWCIHDLHFDGKDANMLTNWVLWCFQPSKTSANRSKSTAAIVASATTVSCCHTPVASHLWYGLQIGDLSKRLLLDHIERLELNDYQSKPLVHCPCFDIDKCDLQGNFSFWSTIHRSTATRQDLSSRCFFECFRTVLTLPIVAVVVLTKEEHMRDALVLVHHVTKLVLCTTSERSVPQVRLSKWVRFLRNWCTGRKADGGGQKIKF